MANIQQIRGPSEGYDWAGSMLPMIQAMTDVKKYQISQGDEARKLAFMYALQGGLGKLTAPVSYGGINVAPTSLEEQLQLKGRDIEAAKALAEIAKLNAETEGYGAYNQALASSMGGGGTGGWTPWGVTLKGPGGSTVDLMPPAPAKKQGGIGGFFQRRTSVPAQSPIKLTEKQQRLLKQAKAHPNTRGMSDTQLIQLLQANLGEEWNG